MTEETQPTDKHPEWLKKVAKLLSDHIDEDCKEKRQFMLPFWKRAEFYWNDIQDVIYDPNISDLRTFSPEEGENEVSELLDNNKIINVYRAFGESVIAAATIGNLAIRFFPENADSPEDLDKSRNFSDKADYIQRVNNIKDLRRKAFTIRWNQGPVASYTYITADKEKFGSYKKSILDEKKSLVLNKKCTNPECTAIAEPARIDAPEDFAANPPQFEQEPCPACSAPLEVKASEEETPKVIGTEIVGRECSTIELFSPLEFTIPFYARKPNEVPYLRLEKEMHFASARKKYPDYARKIHPAGAEKIDALQRNQADPWLSRPSKNLVTETFEFYKPEMYYVILEQNGDNDADYEALEQEYPEGLKLTWLNDILVECENFNFEEHWSFVKSPLDSHIHIRALGNAMIPIQDMENDLVFITMDTIRHAIGETFYDSRILDGKRYKQLMAQPGAMYPLNLANANKPVGDYFFSVKNAALSQEVDRFHERLESRGQLVTGAFPSIYGGQFGEGSKTLGVYELSRAQALQRITIPSNGIDDFLTETVAKATLLYDRHMEGDESYAVEDGTGFKNIALRKSSPSGALGRVETIKSEQFPTTWEQKRAFVMELMDKQVDPMTNPIAAALFSTDNVSIMSQIVGIPELKVPGYASRSKQLGEINELLASKPLMPQPPPPGVLIDPAAAQQMMQPQSTIEPDPDVDDDQIHVDTIISWANSPEGIRAKKENPEGYANVILHLRAHRNALIMKMPQQPPAENVEGEGNDNAQ
jgi:hypothetical protein